MKASYLLCPFNAQFCTYFGECCIGVTAYSLVCPLGGLRAAFGQSLGNLWAAFMRIFLVVRFIGHYVKSTFFLCAFLIFYHSCVQVHIVPLECNQDAPLLRFNRGFRKPRSHKAVAYLLPASPPRFLELYVLVFPCSCT